MEYKNYYFCLDTETSSLYPKQEEKDGLQVPRGQITEVSVLVLDSELNEVERYSSKIKPYNDFIEWNYKAAEITGITKSICEERGRDLLSVIKELNELAKKYKNGRYGTPCIVAHNLTFDQKYLEVAFDYALNGGYRNPKTGTSFLYENLNTIGYDTMALARSKFPNGELLNFKLETVAEFLKIDTNLSLHTSMDDTIICSNVFKYFMSCLRGGVSQVSQSSVQGFKFQF